MRSRYLLGFGLVVVAVACGEDFTTFPQGPGGAGGSEGGSGGDGGAGATGAAGGNGGTGGSGGMMNCVDADGDGVTDCEGDCDDDNPQVFPGAPEICGDGVDNACGNDPDPAGTCGGIGTYVSAMVGSDSNPGTQAEPVATINEGMTKAQTLAGLGTVQPVYVAQGDYDEDVTMVEGVSLWGGHNCASSSDCDWSRDPATYTSAIVNQDLDGIYIGHAVTNVTEISGFTILGDGGTPGGGTVYSAMFVQGSPRIINNHIISGDVTSCGTNCGTRGILMEGAPAANQAAVIRGNLIEGGDTSGSTIGISMTNGAYADIDSNEIFGGQGNWPRCITMGGGAITARANIVNNDLHAGDCNGNNTTFAMFLGQGVSPTIDGNRINADPAKVGTCPSFTGNWWTGGIESEGATAIITNNVIYGVASPRSTAVMLADCEGSCQLGQSVLVNNTLHGEGMPATGGGNATISVALVFKTWKAGQNVVVGRVRNNVLIGGLGTLAFGGFEDVTSSGTPVMGSTAQPQEFDNNAIYDATVLYEKWDGTQYLTLASISDVNTQVNGADDNIDSDCQLDASDHLMAGSPCIDQGTQSGGETPATDMDGDARPMGSEVDIGADEAG